MKRFRLSRFCSLFLSFSLLFAQLPLVAMVEHYSAQAEQQMQYIHEKSAVNLYDSVHNIADFIIEMSGIDNDPASPVNILKDYLEEGFAVADKHEILKVFGYIDWLLEQKYLSIDTVTRERLVNTLDTLVQALLNNELSDASDDENRLPVCILDKNIVVKGKARFKNDAIFYDDVRFHDPVKFYKRAHFKKSIVVDGAATIQDVVADTLQVNSCIENLCVENLSVVDGSISGTLSINDAVIQTLDLSGGLVISDLTLDSATIGDAVIDNLQVNNCIESLCVENLSVVDGSVSGTFSINEAVIQTLDVIGGLDISDLTLNTATIADAVIDNLQVNNCIENLCVENLSVIDGSVSGTLSINDAVIQNLDLVGGLVIPNITLDSATIGDAVIGDLVVTDCIENLCVDNLTVNNCIPDLCVNNLAVNNCMGDLCVDNLVVNNCIPELCVIRGSLIDLVVSGTLTVADAFIEELAVGQNTLRFNDASNLNYVGMTAATTVPSSYTVNLPTVAPTANQVLRANATTPTNLEWAAGGSAIPPTASKTIYVAKYGNDTTGDGSFSNPFLTLSKGLNIANSLASAVNPVAILISSGIYVENNSVGALAVTSPGISIEGDSVASVIIMPGTPANTLLSANQSVRIANVTFASSAPVSTGLALFAGGLSTFNNIRVVNFQTGVSCSGGAAQSYGFSSCLFSDNGTAISVNNARLELNVCSIFGVGSLAGPAAHVGVAITGSQAGVLIDGGVVGLCATGINLTGNANLTMSAVTFKLNSQDVIQNGSSLLTITGSTFEFTSGAGDVDIAISGPGAIANLIGCQFNGNNMAGVPQGTALSVTNSAEVVVSSGSMQNYTTGIEIGDSTDTASTKLSISSFVISGCTMDIVQDGLSSLDFNASTASGSKIVINDPTNVALAFFDSEENNALSIGSTSDVDTVLVKAKIDGSPTVEPNLSYASSLYATQAIGVENPSVNPTSLFVISNDDANVSAITTDRAQESNVRLMSDEGAPVGGTSALRGWDIYKNGNTAELIFRYQNNDPILLGATLPYTVMQLDGANNQVQLPTAGTQIVWGNDVNLYRSAANVLKTDDNFIVNPLTPGRVVITDLATNQLASSITTATEVGYLSGVTSAIQTQLNNKVSRSGDTMTGALQLPAGSTATPSLVFTGSTTTGLSASSGNLSVSTSGVERMKVSSSGVVSVNGFTTPGVVHNDASGNLSTSLIVNADIDPIAGITDTKLATISTAGKVANSATTATSANTPSTIVLRDASGNFSAGTITANLSGNATTATTATNFGGSFSGDVTGTQSATVVSLVGGKTATAVASATTQVEAATNTNTPSTLVRRDATGSFAAQTVSVVDEVATGSVTVTPFTSAGVVHNDASGLLSSSLIVNADVSPSAAIMDTKLATISTPGKVANSATTATSANTANTIVLRDASGNFSAGTITGNLSGNATTATTATNFGGSFSGDVTGTQNATVVSLVGGQSAANVAAATVIVNAATNTNTASTLVLRDATGSFAAQTVSVVDEVATGSVTVTPFNTAGVVHNNASGLLSSSLVVNADISPTAAIADTKLATITTAGKVANSATTATSANTANAIVARDASGNFSAGTITANLTGSASNNVLKAGDTMTGTLNMASQNQIHFQDSGSNFVGLQAPTTVPTSYTLAMPSVSPTVGQSLRSGAVTATNLEWVTEGGSISPTTSRTIYVTKYGNDVTGNGSFDNPYATLSKAINIANGISTAANPVVIAIAAGQYVEDNSAGPISLTAEGVSITGDSPTSVIIIPTTLSNDLLLINASVIVSKMSFVAGGVSTAAAVTLTAGTLTEFLSARFIGFQTGAICGGSIFDSYAFRQCYFVDNTTGIAINGTVVESNSCTILGSSSLMSPGNTGINVTGAGGVLICDGGVFGFCSTAVNVNNNASATITGLEFESNIFDIVQSTSAQVTLSGSNFQYATSPGDIKFQCSGAGSVAQITGCRFDSIGTLGTGIGTAIAVTDGGIVSVSSSGIVNYNVGIQVGDSNDTSTTVLNASSVSMRSNATYDILQQGSSTLNFTSGAASGNLISISDPTNVDLAFFDINGGNALTIGSTANQDTTLLEVAMDPVNHPSIEYLASLYSTQAVGFENLFGSPSTFFVAADANATLSAITTDRADNAGVRLVSDTGSPVGGTSALRGWDITKVGANAPLSFNYQNSDVSGQSVIADHTVMQLDGVNNLLNLPTTGTQIVFSNDTNLFRDSANVLKTDDNLIVGTLTPGRVVTTDGTTNQLTSSTTTATELGYLSGVTSPIQTQLNNKVSRSGDTMTGALQLPAGTTANPSLVFTGSTAAGFSSPVANQLSFSTAGVERMKISPTGTVAINQFGTAGIVHNDASGNLSTSLIVNGDIANATISNAKLASISSSNTPGSIVVRDGSGNFETNMITIDGTVMNPTDVATKAYVDSAVATGFEVKEPALVASVTNVPITGLYTIDGVALTAGDRVLLVGQTNPVDNGLWVASAGAWTRPADFANGTPSTAAYVLVTAGTTYAGASWVSSTPSAIIGTDPLMFAQFSLATTTNGANIGSGTGLVFANKTGVTLNFRSLAAGPHVTYTTNTNDVTLTTDATSANTVSAIVARDASGNFSAGTITANLTGSASNNVLKAGDTMTGALTIPVGSVANPSLNFTGSTTTGLSSAVADTLVLSTAGTNRVSVSPTGTITINDLASVGVVHSDATGLLTSSLIVNGDVSPTAAIADTKLATIATAGKVANTATTATSANTANAIVARDASGNFNANIITATLSGSATNNVLKAGDTMTGALQLPAGTNAAPSLVFTGSTTTGLSANTGNLSLNTNGLERMRVSSGGIVSIDGFTSAGVVHNDASGNLASSLIVNGDIDAAAAIADTKLATISTAGKVANSATTATSANTPSTIVLRDASGNFSAGTITGNLAGNATTATTATNFSGSFSGDVTGTQNATVVSLVGGKTAAAVASATTQVEAATNTNTASTLVLRDATGSFAAETVSLVDEVATGSVTVTPFNTAGVVHNNASGLLSSSLIVNVDVSATAAIADTKLATISTPGKVANSATTATSANTPSTIVLRDASGNFSAGTITGNLSGNATTATTATNFSGSFSGDVTGTQNATVVSLVGGQSAASVAAATVVVNASTSTNTANTLVRRDGTGSFAAQTVSVVDEVATGSVTVTPFNTAGVVHNNASGLLSSSLIVNGDISATAAIADTKLATITTAGKVANSATTATDANIANAIVARDVSGNFSAGTITANLTGSASNNVLKAGDTMTGTLNMASQNQIRFQDTGSNFVGLRAPATVPASYTLSLPSTTPIAGQTLRAGLTTPTNLEWVTEGSSITPVNSRTIYVTKYGNDITGDGSFDNPYLSLSKAIDVANSLSSAANPIVISLAAGVYVEDNTAGPLTITAEGIAIVSPSNGAVVISPADLTQNLLLLTQTIYLENLTFVAQGVSSAAAVVATSGNFSSFNNLQVFGFQVGVECSGGATESYGLDSCLFASNGTALYINNTLTECRACTVFGAAAITDTPANTGILIDGSQALCLLNGGLCGACSIGIQVQNNAVVTGNAISFGFNAADFVQTTGSQVTLTACIFEFSVGASDVDMQVSGTGTKANLLGCSFNGKNLLGVGQGTAVAVFDGASISLNSGKIESYTTGIQLGLPTDTSSTICTASSLDISDCDVDIVQEGSSTLAFSAGISASSKIFINDPTNVSMAFFDLDSNSALSIGSTTDVDTKLIQVEMDTTNQLSLEYKSALYSSQAVGLQNPLNNPTSLFAVSSNTTNLDAITTNRAQSSGLRLFSDTGAPYGTTAALRGWSIDKNASTAELSFKYQNNDTVGQPAVSQYTFMQLDSVNNQLQLPATGTQIVWGNDVNLYRSAANVLKTDDNFIVNPLTPGRVVITDGTTNQLASSVTTATELGYLSGVTSSLQTQLNNKVSRSGDTMTGALQLPAGTTALPSLVFTGSTTTGLSANTGTLSLSTNGAERMRVSSSGVVSVNAFTTAGVVHNNASGNLSSSLIVDADVSASAGIVDTKLATIVTAGKVANSATTATNGNTPNSIVSRDASGNFVVNEIAITGTVTNPTDAATKAYVDSVVGVTGTNLNTPNTVVRRDGTGSFAAQVVSLVDEVATGSITVTPFSAAGLVHNNASGLLSSSLLVNADVSATAAIADTKLATITTAGKVANSATTATNANTANAIVSRDASGNFSVNEITILGTVTNATDAATKAYVDSAVGVTGTNLNTPNTVVRRDGTGSFAAQVVSLVDEVATGSVTVTPFSTAGIVHNNAAGLLSSSLIVNADVAAAAAIADTKLATISTAGKVANTATTATSANTANAIVARDASGNFTTNEITITGTVTNATDAATKAYVDSSVGGTGTNLNTANTLVRRDGTGSFAAQTVSLVDEVATGSITVTPFNSAGIVHNSAAGLLSSSLIVNADVSATAAIADTKLATISTAGKVANSATTATTANTPSTIVLRDASGNFSAGTITANLTGNATTATTAGSATNFSGSLAGDVTGTQGATVVALVGGQSAASVAAATVVVNAATSANTPSAIVRRDASGNFSAGTITASLTGSASNNVLKAGDTMTGALQLPAGTAAVPSLVFTGSTTTGLSAPTANTLSLSTNAVQRMSISSAGVVAINGLSSTGVVHTDINGNLSTSFIVNNDIASAAGIVDTKLATISTAGKVANSATTATVTNTSNAIVTRDVSGNFSAGAITANLVGNATTATTAGNFTGSLSGDVTGTQSATVVSLVGGQTAATVAAGAILANASTSSNVVSSIVRRDGTGSFVTQTITINGSVTNPTDAATKAYVDAVSTGTNLNTPNTVVRRDGTGSFAAQVVSVTDVVASGSISIPTTASLTTGTIQQNGSSLLHTFGSINTFVGQNAGNFTMAGTGGNVGVGRNALTGNVTGSSNTAVGTNALQTNTTGTANTGIGSGALSANTTGINNTAVGASSLAANITGFNNTAVGYLSLALNTTGFGNTAVGTSSLAANTIGSNNTSVGLNSLVANTTGANNSALGTSALASNTSGIGNTAIGNGAMQLNVTGSGNTAVGAAALSGNTIGARNIAIGVSALSANTTGTDNTVIGYNTATGITTGNSNTIIGSSLASNLTTGTNNIYIDGSGLNPANESSTIRIGNTQTSCFVKGIFGVSVGSPQFVTVSSAGQLGSTTSAGLGTSANTPNTLVARDGSGNFAAGTITATLNGSATSFSGSLSGDVTGTQAATVVSSVGGQTAANVAAGVTLANAATSGNTANAIVRRDSSGNFNATLITANLNGNATTATSATTATTANNFSGSLSGDVTGTQAATVVSTVGGQSAGNVATATIAANAATGSNVNNTIVRRDSSGNFSANIITASLSGNATTATTATTATSFSGALVGDVTGNQTSTVVSSVGGQTAANVATASVLANAATTNNTANTIVRRDGSGNFSAGTITANLTGNATTATTATNSTNFTGSLSGDVTGTQAATVVSSVGGQTAANVAAATVLANAATTNNTANTIVRRDGSGNFSAGTINADLTGAASQNVLKAGDTMTGTLQLPAGTLAAPSLTFTGALAGTGLSMLGNSIQFSTNSAERLRVGSGGIITIPLFTTAGVVHNNTSGNLLSSLIVNADVDAAAAIADTKLATISTAGKVANSATTATSANTANTIVARDASGNFSAGTITANLTGNATTATNSTNFTGSLSGDVTGTQAATVVSSVGGQTAANVAAATVLANAATTNNTANTIVRRDASGNFSAGTITADLTGAASDNVLKAGDTMTGTLRIPAGTLAVPSLTFTGALAGTGLSMLANSIQFSTNGLERLRVGSSGLITIPLFTTNGVVHNNTSGNLTTSLIVNADVDAAAAIADTKLATISTAGKVANSATTATNANTASAIVARDASGNFITNQITISGTVTNATDVATKAYVDGAVTGTNLNTPNTVVRRDGTGSFSAQTISVVDEVITGNLSLADTTSATVGVVTKGGVRFIHNVGTNNTFVGKGAGTLTTTGTGNNTALGANALDALTTGSNNTAVGSNALGSILISSDNTAVGANALAVNVTGNLNTAVGSSALSSNTTGAQNTAVGFGALSSNLIGAGNTGVGYSALSLTTGLQNTAIGGSAMILNTGGVNNTACGYAALSRNTTGGNNVAVGSGALSQNTTGGNNVAVGMNCLINDVTGIQNTAVGFGAGSSMTTGSTNVMIGFNVGGATFTAGSNNIYIDGAGTSIINESNTTRIGATQTRCFMAGIRGVTTGLAAIPVLVDLNGQLGTTSSSARFKHNIEDMDDASSALFDLEPVTFAYNSDESEAKQFGLIAEQVSEVLPELVVYEEDGSPYTVRYDVLPVLLLNEMKKQKTQIDRQEEEMQRQKEDIDMLLAAVKELQKKVEAFTA